MKKCSAFIWSYIRERCSCQSLSRGNGGYQPGPHFFVYRMYSEMGLTPSDTLVAFWEALQDARNLNAIHEFATINANLTEPKVGDGQIQLQMIQRYVEPDLRAKLLGLDRLQGNAHSVVFYDS